MTLEPAALLASPPLGARLARQLRLQVLAGDLPPHAHLVESRLAQQYGVSRGPVRDALKELEHEGIIYSARQGHRVAQIARQDVDEIFAIRHMAERTAIESGLAAEADWAPLEQRAAEMKAAALRGDQPAFAEADLNFHRSVLQIGGGKRLQAVWHLFEPTLAALFTLNPHPGENLAVSAEDHAALPRMLQTGDDRWRLWLEQHLESARLRFLDTVPAPDTTPQETPA
ncbi:GntR family transcriptional regulator [Nesterenkonia sp. NBAIMH1]|uniref:GntR family transcriptional regulator n=1 Tax=Nesterenkonia sp. NBAIMH1 TaxID=2600320 RepID=UPI0011B640E4|nr:GntR family transcriptional regulator [Nesterenkonia sp. NBAIMH1]